MSERLGVLLLRRIAGRTGRCDSEKRGKLATASDEPEDYDEGDGEKAKFDQSRHGSTLSFCWIRLWTEQHGGQQRGSGCEMLEDNRFVACVRSFADRAHSVKRGYAERGGEIAVGAASGCGFFQLEAEFGG